MRKNKILVKLGYDPASGYYELLNLSVRHSCPVLFGTFSSVLDYFPVNKFDIKVVQAKIDYPF